LLTTATSTAGTAEARTFLQKGKMVALQNGTTANTTWQRSFKIGFKHCSKTFTN